MTARVLVIDNYDSFVFNLVQYLGELKAEPIVRRNDQVTLDEVAELAPDAILISPGPGAPGDAGISNDLVRHLGPTIPTLGVCLGHQCIGEVFGGEVVRAPRPMHAMVSSIEHDGSSVLQGLPNPFQANRYHSLVVDPQSIPDELEVTARALDDGTVQALNHREYPIYGVQFHPESIRTDYGHRILSNFLQLAGFVSEPPEKTGQPVS